MLQILVNFTGTNAIFLAVILSLFFWIHKKGNQASNRMLSLSLLAFGVMIFSTMPWASYQFANYYKIAFILRRVAFLVAPLFYFYIRSLTGRKQMIRPMDLFHFLPFLILLGLTLYQGLIRGIWELRFVHEYYVQTTAIVLHNIIYFWFANRYLKQSGLSIKRLLFPSEHSYYQILQVLLAGFIIIWLVNIQNLIIFKVLKLYQWCPYASSVNCLIPFVFLSILLLSMLIKPELAYRYRGNGETLSDARQSRYQQKIAGLMEEKKLYLNPDLSMQELSEELSVPVKHLSYMLNQVFHLNFYDYVNQYRIEASKALLSNPAKSKMTILEIAYEVGFNSKSTFNAAFKKQTGITPSAFRKTNHGKSFMKVPI